MTRKEKEESIPDSSFLIQLKCLIIVSAASSVAEYQCYPNNEEGNS